MDILKIISKISNHENLTEEEHSFVDDALNFFDKLQNSSGFEKQNIQSISKIINLRNQPLSIILIDKDKNIVDAPLISKDFFDITIDDLKNKNFIDLCNEDCQKLFEYEINSLEENSSSDTFNIQLIYDDNIKYCEITAQYVTDEEEIFYILYIFDVSNVFFLENAYRSIVDNPLMGVIIASQDGISYINDRVTQITGYSKKELESIYSIRDTLIYPDDRKIIYESTRKIAVGKEKEWSSVQVRFIHKSGRIIWIESTAREIELFGKKSIFQSFFDITKIKEYESAQKEEIERLSSYFHSDGAIKLLINPVYGNIIDVSTGATNFYGYSREEMLQKTIYDLNILSKEEVDAKMKEAKKQDTIMYQFKHKLSDGTIRDVETYPSTLKISGQTHLLSTVFDVTERNMIHSELNNRINDLDEINEFAEKAISYEKDEEILEYILDYFEKKFFNYYFMVSKNIVGTDKIKIQSLRGVNNKYFNKIFKLLGFNPFEQTFDMNEVTYDYVYKGKLSMLPDGLYSVTEGFVPKVATTALKKLFNIEDVYTIGIQREKSYLQLFIFLLQANVNH